MYVAWATVHRYWVHTVEMGFDRWRMRRRSGQRFHPNCKNQQRDSSYNQQQMALGDAAADLGAAALRLPAFLMTPTHEAQSQKARLPWLGCSSNCVLGVFLCHWVGCRGVVAA